MRITAEPGCFGPGTPHIEHRAALNARAGTNGSFVVSRRNHCHPGQPVRHASADILHRAHDSWKNLTSSAEFHTWFDHVAYTGDSRVFAWLDGFEPRLCNSLVSRH